MGMYDTVEFCCPECDEIIDVQTKGGDCVLDTYPEHDVCIGAAWGIDGRIVQCDTCQEKFIIKATVKRIPVVLRRVK